MKVLLVQNDVHSPKLLEKFFSAEEVTVIPWDGFKSIDTSLFDFAVLSGSSRAPVVGNENELRDELNFIRQSTIPILGICYGFELIVTAFGGTLKRMAEKEQGVLTVEILLADPIFRGIESLFVYEGHRWIANSLPDTLIPLARSAHGIEAIKHRERCIYGFQFHPEKLERETEGRKILENFISLIRI